MDETDRKQHSYYCTRKQHATIGKRAKAAGKNRSNFMWACALHGDAGGEKHVLTADEQRTMFERSGTLERFMNALGSPIPDLDMSALEALEMLYRVEKERDPGR